MDKLEQGAIDFNKRLSGNQKNLYSRLAEGGSPEALFITCADSRVIPAEITSSSPGDLFTLRNVGNLVPQASHKESSVSATLEFGVLFFKVKHIIICGHSQCNAMDALLNQTATQEGLTKWLEYGKPSLIKNKKDLILDPNMSLCNQLSQVNVLQQMQHLTTYPFIEEKVAKKELALHGWWFDIKTATVFSYDPAQKAFISLD